jgi:hypothetical protein
VPVSVLFQILPRKIQDFPARPVIGDLVRGYQFVKIALGKPRNSAASIAVNGLLVLSGAAVPAAVPVSC